MTHFFALLALLAAPPATGDLAPDFTLNDLAGKRVTLSEFKGPVALIVLRGFPGYQCPICNRQVRELIANASGFAGRTVLLVYPGPQDKAAEFTSDKTLPANMHLLLDPDYKFTLQYGLRWEAPKETAYPSTFILDKTRRIRFAKVSNSHGGRTSAAEVISELDKLR